MRVRALVTAAALVGCTSAWANDGIAGLDTGNLTLGHTDKVAMAREVLEMWPDKITVDYDFVNESDHDVRETLVFPLPRYGNATHVAGDGYYGGQPRGFKILVDGEPKSFSTRVVAYFKGRDITAELHALGLTDRQIALFPGPGAPFSETAKPFTAAQTTALSRRGWLEDESADGPTPGWEVSVNYLWYLTFPAGKHVHVHHTYRPFPTIGIATSMMRAAELREQACADTATLAAWKKVSQPLQDGYRQTNGRFVGYVLKTGNTWKDGIRDFTLRLHRLSPTGLVSTCFDAPVADPDPLTREYHLMDFHPAKDLSVYFGNLPDAPDPSEKVIAPVVSGE